MRNFWVNSVQGLFWARRGGRGALGPRLLRDSGFSHRCLFHVCLSEVKGSVLGIKSAFFENSRDGGGWWAASMGSHRVGHD